MAALDLTLLAAWVTQCLRRQGGPAPLMGHCLPGRPGPRDRRAGLVRERTIAMENTRETVASTEHQNSQDEHSPLQVAILLSQAPRLRLPSPAAGPACLRGPKGRDEWSPIHVLATPTLPDANLCYQEAL